MPQKRKALLKSISPNYRFVDAVDEILSSHFLKEFYRPLFDELRGYVTVKNSEADLQRAIQDGRISFYNGRFTGKFSSKISRELKRMGASWDGRGEGSFKIRKIELTETIIESIETAESTWLKKNKLIEKKLAKLMGEDAASKIDLTSLIDKELFRIDGELEKSFRGLVVVPKLTHKEIAAISKNYNNNMRLYVQKFTHKEIKSLRKKVAENVIQGRRYEGLAKTIQKSYGVSQSKAKFLARQETNLFLAKFKEARYTKAGIEEYVWDTVTGSAAHPVRDEHAKLKGKTFRFDDPPVVNKKGDKKNPGEDYGCRCSARAVIRF